MYLLAYQHLPYARAAEMLGDWIGAPLSTGTLAAFMAHGAEDLHGFLDDIHAQLITAPVAHFDETRARVQGRLRWLFCASTGRATYYSLHDKRGFEGLDHAGVLPHFTGTAVHDDFKPYRRYTAAQHSLCNAHHPRELLGVIKEHPEDPNQSWALFMDRLLRVLAATVQHAQANGKDWLEPIVLAGYRATSRSSRSPTTRTLSARSPPASAV